jgi:hypothetical protein
VTTCPPNGARCGAAWRRAYLRAYSAAVAGQLRGLTPPGQAAAAGAELYQPHYAAAAAAELDARRASLALYSPPPAQLIEDSPLRAVRARPAPVLSLPGPAGAPRRRRGRQAAPPGRRTSQ